MPPRTPRLPGAGEVVAGKYRLERLLKQGGMGAVWVATHLGLDERVALKFMDPRRVSSPDARARFAREAKAAAQVRSANIVQILDHGVDNHIPYIAMELLSGEDLGGRLRRAGKLSMSDASALLDDIAHALDRAHALGIVHRDLKPENIFLSKDGDHEVPKILDFGIALELQPDATDDSAATQDGVLLGTPYFMSPEQVRGRANIDHRSDLWSLGVILFRAITGIRPFGRGAAADVIVQICSDPIPRASVVAPDLPEEVDRFFEKALARDAAKRFSSAREMANAFTEIAKLAEAAEKTQVDPSSAHTSRPMSPRGSRKGPPPLPGSMPAPGASTPPRTVDRAGEAVEGGGEPSRTSGVLRKAAAAAESGAERHHASATMRAHGVDTQVPEPVSATTPPPVEIAEAVTTEVHIDRKGEEAAARARDAALQAGASEEAARASRGGAEVTKVEAQRPPPVERAGEARSRAWIALAGGAIAAAVLLVGFREKIFAPEPVKDPNGATIVLTAGTVVLVGPGGRVPVDMPAQPDQSRTATTSTASTAGSAAASASAPASALAASATTNASAAGTTTTATSAAGAPTNAAGAATQKPSAPAPEPRPKVEAKPVETKPAETKPPPPPPPPPKKEDPDLGY